MRKRYREWRDRYQWRPGKRMTLYAILLWNLTECRLTRRIGWKLWNRYVGKP